LIDRFDEEVFRKVHKENPDPVYGI